MDDGSTLARRIIVVDDPPRVPMVEVSASAEESLTTRREKKRAVVNTPSGYPPGIRLWSQGSDRRVYQVDPSGAFRRITPKPLSKKARRKLVKA